ncbi:MAG: Ig-like domain-containing protein, partial [Desulfofundulus sp.]
MRKASVLFAVLLAMGLFFHCFAQPGEAATVVKATRPEGTATVVSPSPRAGGSPVVVLPPPRFGGIPEAVKPSRNAGENFSVVVQPPRNAGNNPVVVQPEGRGGSTPGSTPQKPVPVPVALTVTPSSVTVEQGKSVTVKVTVKYSDGSVADITSLFSLDAGSAKLDNGVVTGLKCGQGVFTFTYGSLKTTLAVGVTPPAGFGTVAPPDMTSSAEKYTIRWTYNGRSFSTDVAVPADLLRYDREIQSLADKCRTDYSVY